MSMAEPAVGLKNHENQTSLVEGSRKETGKARKARPDQANAGGARAGGGKVSTNDRVLVSRATWVALTAATAVNPAISSGGGADRLAHSGQSSVWLEVLPGAPSSPATSTCRAPVPEQISCMPLGCTTGDAMAAPRDNANQTSTQRASRWALRRDCIAPIIARLADASFARSVLTCAASSSSHGIRRCPPRRGSSAGLARGL
jgi:hypothetical protein